MKKRNEQRKRRRERRSFWSMLKVNVFAIQKLALNGKLTFWQADALSNWGKRMNRRSRTSRV